MEDKRKSRGIESKGLAAVLDLRGNVRQTHAPEGCGKSLLASILPGGRGLSQILTPCTALGSQRTSLSVTNEMHIIQVTA